MTAPELDRDRERVLRIVLLDPDGGEVASAKSQLVAHGSTEGRDTNLAFSAPGDDSFRILANGSEQRRPAGRDALSFTCLPPAMSSASAPLRVV